MKRIFFGGVALALGLAVAIWPSSIGKVGGGVTTTVGTWAQLQAATPGAGAGANWVLTNSFYDQVTSAAGGPWRYFQRGREMFPIDLTAFTAVNQGSTTTSTTNGSVSLDNHAANVNEYSLWNSNTTTTAAFSATAYLMLNKGDHSSIGVCSVMIGDGTKFFLMGFTTQSNFSIIAEQWTNATTFSNQFGVINGYAYNGPGVWVRITDDGVNTVTFSYSADGANFLDVFTTNHAFSDPDRIGFGIYRSTGAESTKCSYPSLQQL